MLYIIVQEMDLICIYNQTSNIKITNSKPECSIVQFIKDEKNQYFLGKNIE